MLQLFLIDGYELTLPSNIYTLGELSFDLLDPSFSLDVITAGLCIILFYLQLNNLLCPIKLLSTDIIPE